MHSVNATTTTTMTTIDPVIVIGAGISGLAAALELEARGCQVIVLEARSDIGGRIRSVDVSKTTTTDIGGTYIHGSSMKNSLMWLLQEQYPELALKSHGGSSSHPGKGSAAFFFNKRELNLDEIERGAEVFQEWKDRMKEKVKRLNKEQQLEGGPALLKHISNEVIQDMVDEKVLQSPLDYSFLDHERKMSFEHDSCLPFYDVSLQGIIDNRFWVEYEGDDHILADGMTSLINRMAQDIQGPILCNTVVTSVHSSSDGCKIRTACGKQFSSKACVVTLPLGVLKKCHQTMFDPPLDSEKQDALQRAGVGTINTVIVQWDQPMGCSKYLLGVDTVSNPLALGFVADRCLTKFYIQGDHHPFDNIEYWKERAVEVMQELDIKVSMENIVNITLSGWHADCYSLGSYSAPTTYTNGNVDRAILQRPIGNTLFFAGEHTNTKGRYQSMDGAFDSGVLAADQVAAALELSELSYFRNPHQ